VRTTFARSDLYTLNKRPLSWGTFPLALCTSRRMASLPAMVDPIHHVRSDIIADPNAKAHDHHGFYHGSDCGLLLFFCFPDSPTSAFFPSLPRAREGRSLDQGRPGWHRAKTLRGIGGKITIPPVYSFPGPLGNERIGAPGC